MVKRETVSKAEAVIYTERLTLTEEQRARLAERLRYGREFMKLVQPVVDGPGDDPDYGF